MWTFPLFWTLDNEMVFEIALVSKISKVFVFFLFILFLIILLEKKDLTCELSA